MKDKYILALDQGTTSSRAIIFNHNGDIVGKCQKEITQIYPQAGWVEHDPLEIWVTQCASAQEVMKETNIPAEDIIGIGITNQRETTVIWNRRTGKPVYNAIVWQCRRTAELCENLVRDGNADYISQSTGLVVDAYFSASKVRWVLDHVENGQKMAESGDLLFGTIDSWLVWNLTKGKLHITDYSNASRTMLFNIRDLCWDQKILSLLNIPEIILPQVCPSSYTYGYADPGVFGTQIPICGIAGDQQAALFGQTCFEPGMAKNTYGTGCFLLLNTGNAPVYSRHNLLSTIAWGLDGQVEYALEGSVFIAGAVIQWLRDELGLIQNSAESEYYAALVPDTQGVFFVPAFVGLGAPYWDMHARGLITGLTRGTTKNHIIRSGLESIAYQTYDVLSAMQKDTNLPIRSLQVDGGGSNNNFLMQFQADILGIPVESAALSEITALGAAYFAGLALEYWSKEDLLQLHKEKRHIYLPKMSPAKRKELVKQWGIAIAQTRSHS